MTVAELIEKLQSFDPRRRVVVVWRRGEETYDVRRVEEGHPDRRKRPEFTTDTTLINPERTPNAIGLRIEN